MAGVRGSIVLVGTILFLCLNGINAQSWAAASWTPAHATFYGGSDASGTMGGSCGYGNLYSQGYGTNTAALSVALFNNGLSCGACFLIQCTSPSCYPGASVTITATNECPDGSFGGWCNQPNLHFDMAYPMFTTLAPASVGVVPVQYMRVQCQKTGGVVFTINGNPYFFLVLVTNVGGYGNVIGMQMCGSNSGYYSMSQNWGQNWELDGHPELQSQSISFLVSLENGSSQTFSNVASPNWSFGQSYQSSNNF